jgi:NAD(P)-dependent dehydrogenase (short-subunit alcohol dehydrogenase family)
MSAYIITGPTSGMGYFASLYLAKKGLVVLVGRNKEKLENVKEKIEKSGGEAIIVICDFSDLESVKKASNEIVSLNLDIKGIANNAGIQTGSSEKSKQGYDLTFSTNHLGPFLFTEMLIPHLKNKTNILFTCSAAEDIERKSARVVGFRGGRFISVEKSANGIWNDGSKTKGFDSYATSKQCILATAYAFAEQYKNLNINGLEPGVSPGTNLGKKGVNIFVKFITKYILNGIAPFVDTWSTPKIAGKLIGKLITEENGSGNYFDEKGELMKPSKTVQDMNFCNLVVKETREFLNL